MLHVFNFLFLISSLPYYPVLQAQGKISVVNAKTGERIPYASIKVLHSEKGAYTDESGQFQLAFASGDTLLFTSIGYQPTRFVITDVQISEFRLAPAVQELQKVTVNNKKLYKKLALGNLNLKTDGYWYFFAKGEQVAQRIYFPLEANNIFKIKKVIIPIEPGKKSIPILLHIYAVNETSGLPAGELLLNTYLITKKSTRGNKAIIDLEKEDLWINESSVFVCIQGQPPPGYNRRYSGDIKLPLSYKLSDTLTFINAFFSVHYNWSPVLHGRSGGVDTKLINTLFSIDVEEYR